MKARAAVQVDDRKFEIEEFDLPHIGPDEAIQRVDACGLCGSDVEQFDGALAAFGSTYPLIPGHEPVGTIAEIGPTAAELRGGAGRRPRGRRARLRLRIMPNMPGRRLPALQERADRNRG